MNYLSSRFTGFYLYVFYPLMTAETIYVTSGMENLSPYLLVFPAGIFLIVFFWIRKVRIIRYDDNLLYVRNLWMVEQISIREVESVNIPGKWDSIYEIELRSGRKIEFIPTFHPPSLLGSNDVPANVRRFQNVIKNQEREGLPD